MKLEVFDRHMGTAAESDPEQIQFAADLAWLKAHGVEVLRVDSAQLEAFAGNALAQQTLREKGAEKLPFFFVNGRLVGTGYYPSRKQLAQVIDLAAGGAPGKLLSDGASCCGPDGCCE